MGEGKHKEKDRVQQGQSVYKSAKSFCFLRTVQIGSHDKRDAGTNVKDGNINPNNCKAEYSRISIEENGNERCSGQNAGQDRQNDIRTFFFPYIFEKETVEQSREKQKFHMLPRRFADRTEKSDERCITGPFIEKMRQCTKDSCEQKSGDKDVFAGKFMGSKHNKSPFISGKVFYIVYADARKSLQNRYKRFF